MKISLQAIKQIYAQSELKDFLPEPDKLAQKIGAQIGEIEETIDLSKKYKDILIVKVVACEKHPNADKLSVCKIDDGGMVKNIKRDETGLVQVVCGAPNVKKDMLAAWLPPGSTVPATFDKEPFVLEARELRGEISNGMLASASELDLNDDHSGIIEIDKDIKPGESFASAYKLNDFIFDIENKMFTHRPDCFGLLGLAREISGIYGEKFISPQWYTENPTFPEVQAELKLEVNNQVPEIVPRFCAVAIADVHLGPSPLWMQVMLSKFGVKSINNIVDITNFYMLLTGQPLHAYDYDKLAKLSNKDVCINVRLAKKDEKLKLLNGKEAVMNGDEVMIATDSRPIGIGGVIGGSETEVDENTKNIILECANFDSYSIRRTSMAHGIFTDAVTRFTKGQSPHQNLAVLAKITSDIINFTGGKVASKTFDIKGKLAENNTIKITPQFINDRLGLQLSAEDISKLLQNVELSADVSSGELNITAPFWRTDIGIPEDIVEEVGRLYGYDHLPLKLPKKPMSASLVAEELQLKQKIRERLSSLGANETLGYSFVRGNLLENIGQDKADSYKVKNALSPDLEYYRQSLTPSLLEKIHPNIKAGFDEFALFEIGKVHIKGKETDGLPDELGRVALVVASKNKKKQPAFYTAKKYLVDLLSEFGINEESIEFAISEEDKDSAAVYYQKGRSAEIGVDKEIIGRLGEYSQKVTAKLKLPEYSAGFEIGLKPLMKVAKKPAYQPLSRYPSTDQDICLKTEIGLSYTSIKDALNVSLEKNLPEDLSLTLSCIDIFSGDEKTKQTTFRVTATSFERTLTSEIINRLFEKAASELKNSIGADIV